MLRATWDIAPDYSYFETVHRLSDLGAVVTHAARGPRKRLRRRVARSWDFTVEGDLINRFELFEEADLDAAIARFDELNQRAHRRENAASQVGERFLAHIAAGGLGRHRGRYWTTAFPVTIGVV